jgi:hypothetical protein
VVLTSCTSTNYLINVSAQDWVGGLKNSGSGTNYQIHLIAPENHLLFNIKQICINEKKHNYTISPAEFNKGDTILIRSRNHPEKCLYENKIEYTILDKQHQINIDSITELPKLFYP